MSQSAQAAITKNAVDWEAYKQQKFIPQDSGSSCIGCQLGWILVRASFRWQTADFSLYAHMFESREKKQALFDSYTGTNSVHEGP